VSNTAILLVDCPDRKGLVAAIANFLYSHNANILHADQHEDREAGLFFMRVEWDLAEFTLPLARFSAEFAPVAEPLRMNWRLELNSVRPKVALMVSRFDHCLADLLYRGRSGDLNCDFPLVLSNHPDARSLAEFHEVPFYCVPVAKDKKAEAEAEQLELLRQHNIDLIVLARYMQILSPKFVAEYPLRIINVHHSFLPAFQGAKPYHQAHKRGVKLIGATSHFATEILDDGPIIEQDVTRISHRDQIEDLLRKGRDLERTVLSRAVRWWIEHRILVYGNKTVVFD